MLARRGLRVRGSDISEQVVDEARARAAAAGLEIAFKAAPVTSLEPGADAAELVVCCEVLEHVDDPVAALETLAGLARPWLMVSVPREPLWRALNLARLKYVGELGNTPGHLNHWSQARVPGLPRGTGRGGRGPQPAAVDDGALPERSGVSAPRRLLGSALARPGALAIVLLGLAWGPIMHRWAGPSSATTPRSGRSSDGRKNVDRWHWETGDVAWIDGHYYSVKSPGMAAISLPPYLLLEAVGGLDVAGDAAAPGARRRAAPVGAERGLTLGAVRLRPERAPCGSSSGSRTRRRSSGLLTLIAAVIPAVLLLFLRPLGRASGSSPGYGTAAAITLGLATILMTFAAEFFSHAISTTLGVRAPSRADARARRARRVRRWSRVAGLLAGLAVHVRVPGRPGRGGAVRLRARPRRLAAPRGAPTPPARSSAPLPALAFNTWTLGSPLKLAYRDAVAEIGVSGHAEIGLNGDGFFGITLPRLGRRAATCCSPAAACWC